MGFSILKGLATGPTIESVGGTGAGSAGGGGAGSGGGGGAGGGVAGGGGGAGGGAAAGGGGAASAAVWACDSGLIETAHSKTDVEIPSLRFMNVSPRRRSNASMR